MNQIIRTTDVLGGFTTGVHDIFQGGKFGDQQGTIDKANSVLRTVGYVRTGTFHTY